MAQPPSAISARTNLGFRADSKEIKHSLKWIEINYAKEKYYLFLLAYRTAYTDPVT